MSTSNTRVFNPEFAEILEEAFSRCQIRPQTINQDHINEALRSANLMLVKFANAGVQQYRLQQQTVIMEAGEPRYELAAGTLDVWSMVYTRDGQDTPVWPMSRTDYEYIPTKTQPGRPHDFFFDRSSIDNGLRHFDLYPTPDTDGDTIRVWALMRSQDAVGIAENLTVAYEGFDAYAAELAARLARKYAPELLPGRTGLAQEAEDAWKLWRGADRERAPLRLKMRGY